MTAGDIFINITLLILPLSTYIFCSRVRESPFTTYLGLEHLFALRTLL